jgi:hypothetical protein
MEESGAIIAPGMAGLAPRQWYQDTTKRPVRVPRNKNQSDIDKKDKAFIVPGSQSQLVLIQYSRSQRRMKED